MNDHSRPVNPAPDFWTAFSTLAQQGALHQEAIAEALDLNPTDLRCVGFAWSEPDLTPGRLAELTGLTTGAVTGVLDRLERAGFIQRLADPTDRRRTLVRVSHTRGEELGAAYDPLEREVDAIAGRLDEAQLATLTEIVRSVGAAVERDTARLRATTRGGMVGEMFTAPLGDRDHGRLVFQSGAPRIALRAAPLGPASEMRAVAELTHTLLRLDASAEAGELARGVFQGPLPDVRVRGGEVRMQHKRRLDWRRREARVGLNRSIPWEIEIAGGLSSLLGDLRHVRLRDMRVAGSVDDVLLQLGMPDGTSRLRISGGMRDATIEHPAGTALRLSLTGGAHDIRFGHEHLRDTHGTVHLQTREAESAPDRFEVEVSGGARSLRVRTG